MTAAGERPGIVAGRLDPYVYAGYFTALNTARIASSAVSEPGRYTLKHAELWALQLAAEAAMTALWHAIGQHSTHCHGCDLPARPGNACKPDVDHDWGDPRTPCAICWPDLHDRAVKDMS